MAVLSRITCERCNMTVDVSHAPMRPSPKLCEACQGRDIAAIRTDHFAKLDALPLEERLRRVEEWIYDYRPKYVEPPRF